LSRANSSAHAELLSIDMLPVSTIENAAATSLNEFGFPPAFPHTSKLSTLSFVLRAAELAMISD
jgi:hypothetical protein